MNWNDGELRNAGSGKLLRRETADSLTDGEQRFPVIDEIPFLRLNREKLISEVLIALENGDKKAALMLLFQDQDDWAKTAPPSASDLELLFDNENLGLREAMKCLKYGAVADYFAYRWSDPTFLSGLALLEWHLPSDAANVFELCCGIGHYLREFISRGIAAIGADVVFSKLWLARKFVAPTAKLVCADANFSLPFADNSFDAVFCHDAFYFLSQKQLVASELKRVTKNAILIGHAHNSDADNFSSGAAVSVGEYAELFTNSVLYDDDELTHSVINDCKPKLRTAINLRQSQAIAIAENAQREIHHRRGFDLPPPHQSLQVNPLLNDGNFEVLPAPRFPSERYAKEYAESSSYLYLNSESISFADQETAFRGHWESDERLKNLARRRILLDLPENW